MVPVASWVRVWSMRRATSEPGSMLPLTRWAAMSFSVSVFPMIYSSFWVMSAMFARALVTWSRAASAALSPSWAARAS